MAPALVRYHEEIVRRMSWLGLTWDRRGFAARSICVWALSSSIISYVVLLRVPYLSDGHKII